MKHLTKRRTYIEPNTPISVQVIDDRENGTYNVTNGEDIFVMECMRKTPKQINFERRLRVGNNIVIFIKNVLTHHEVDGEIKPYNRPRAEVFIAALDGDSYGSNKIKWDVVSPIPYRSVRTGNEKYLTNKGEGQWRNQY